MARGIVYRNTAAGDRWVGQGEAGRLVNPRSAQPVQVHGYGTVMAAPPTVTGNGIHKAKPAHLVDTHVGQVHTPTRSTNPYVQQPPSR